MFVSSARRSPRRESVQARVYLCRQLGLVLAALLCFALRDTLTHLAPIVASLAVVGALNTLLFARNLAGRHSRTLETAQVVVDVGAISVMVWSSGTEASPFYLLYLVEIPAAAIGLSGRGAAAAVTLSLTGYLAAVMLADGPGMTPQRALHAALLPAVGWLTMRLIARLRHTLQYRAAAAAHEIKNSTHVVADLVRQVREQFPPGEPRAHVLDAALDELESLAGLSQRLFQESRSAPRRRTTVQRLVQDALLLATPSLRAAGISAEVSLPAVPLWLRVDGDATRHALLNLLLNVARHAAPGGRLCVECSRAWGRANVTLRDVPPPVARERAAAAPIEYESWGVGLQVTRELLMREGARLELCPGPGADGYRASVVFPALAWPAWPRAGWSAPVLPPGAGSGRA